MTLQGYPTYYHTCEHIHDYTTYHSRVTGCLPAGRRYLPMVTSPYPRGLQGVLVAYTGLWGDLGRLLYPFSTYPEHPIPLFVVSIPLFRDYYLPLTVSIHY